MTDAAERLQLLDWKRQLSELYGKIRTANDPSAAWTAWRTTRDTLFLNHPQSPLPAGDRGLPRRPSYYPYDSDARALADIVGVDEMPYEIVANDGTTSRFTHFAAARFTLFGQSCELGLFWLEGYGGGLFLPFRDGTSGAETYGGGRYLLDTVKGADLGIDGGRLVLDFNFAYNPSCAYDPRWTCPLAPPGNRLPMALRAGERTAPA
ncbi:MAG TPA: DUF1684 domain-containing protein [bacterium]|nr:DUF1684 domain-containing protein [bacterium]